MNNLRVIFNLGLKNGIDALKTIRAIKNTGAQNIQIQELSGKKIGLSCKSVNGNDAFIKFDYGANKSYQTKKNTVNSVDKTYVYSDTFVSNLKTNKILVQINNTDIFENGVRTYQKTVLSNKVTRTSFIRQTDADGHADYYRVRRHQKMEKLFS